MFTGIVENIGQIKRIEKEGTNIHFYVESEITPLLKIDQSVAHNGVCLTVVEIVNSSYKVTAVAETLAKTSLANWNEGDFINLERAMSVNARLDGHFVQGHVDQTATCIEIEDKEGSWIFHFEFNDKPQYFIPNKGSICIDGVSLTVIESVGKRFYVTIIPYTFEHTCFQYFKIGSIVNIEFDILGKYIEKYLQNYLPATK